MAANFRRRGSFAKTLRTLEADYVDYECDGGATAAAKNQWFFEVAWEVANKGQCALNMTSMKDGNVFLTGDFWAYLTLTVTLAANPGHHPVLI